VRAFKHKSNILTITLITFLFSISTSLADWPIEPYQGNPFFSLEDDRRDFPVAAFCDSVGGVTVIISSEDTNFSSQLFIQGIDIHGNLRWPDNPNGHAVAPHNTLKERYHAVPGPDSTTFVGWANVRYEDIMEDISMELVLQRVGADGQGQWNDGYGVVLSEFHFPYNDYKEIISINPLPDGSVYVLWMDQDVHNEDYDYDGNYHIQRFDSDGSEMWEPGGLEPLPDSLYTSPTPGISTSAVLMDSGHLAFIIENSIIRIRPDGTYVWPRGEAVLDSLNPYSSECLKCIFRDNSDTLVVVGVKGADEYVCYKIDTEGEIILYNEFEYRTNNGIDQAELNKFPSNNYALAMNRTLILLDNQLEPIYPEIGRDLVTDYFYRFDMNSTGIGMSGAYGDDRRNVYRFDTNGDELWTTNVYDDTSGVGRVLPALDENGNMFVFWLKNFEDERWLDCYANVFSPDGVWGEPLLSSVDEENPESNLPELMTLSAYPNPFNGSTTITIELKTIEMVTVKIFDMLGRHVSTLLSDASLSSGHHSVLWETDVKGSQPSLASGVYFVRATTESGRRFTTKVQHIK
jgi:Secretion system C-terminal sorting domain